MIKIGILSNNFEKLSNYEYKLFDYLLTQDWINLSVIILDGRVEKKQNIFVKIFTIKIFTKIFFRILNSFDHYLHKPKKINENFKKKINDKLLGTKIIKVYPVRKKFIDLFTTEDCDIIKKYNLDIIIRNNFKIIQGNILNIPKFGVWSFHHGDNDINRGGPAGFWEVYLKQHITGVTLQKLNNILDGGEIIDKSFYPTKKTFISNNAFIIEKSITLLKKNLKLIYKTKKLNTIKSSEYKNKIYKFPDKFIYFINYFIIFLNNIYLQRIINKIFYLSGYKLNYWGLFINKSSNFENISFSNSSFIKPPKNEFWADPFVINHKGINYVFFENFSYKTNKGKISVGEIHNDNIINVKTILQKDYHISYPFIYKHEDNYFMLPETYQSKRLEIYRSSSFPFKWELYQTAFENQITADPTLFLDNEDNLWLFINKSEDIYNDLSSELYLYKVNNFDFTNLTPHSKNPVIIDSRTARNAGKIIIKNNRIIRPSQYCDGVSYGHYLNLSEITLLNIENYQEKIIKQFKPNFLKNLIGIHHYSEYEKGIVFDSCYKRYKD